MVCFNESGSVQDMTIKLCRTWFPRFSLVAYIAYSIGFKLTNVRMTYPELGAGFFPAICENIVLFLLFTSIVLKFKYFSLRQCALVVLTLVILWISALRTNDFSLVYGYLVVIAVVGNDVEVLFKTYYCTVFFVLATVLILGVTGLLYNRDHLLDGRVLFPCGILHPNDIGALLFSAIGAMAFESWRKRTWAISLGLAVASLLFCGVVLSSGGSTVILFLLVVTIALGHSCLAKYFERIPRWCYVCLSAVLLFALVFFALFVTVNYDGASPLIGRINQALHFRPFFSNKYFGNNGGFTLLGRQYAYISGYHNGLGFYNLDCSYSQLAMVYGLPSLGIFILNFFVLATRSNIQGRYFLVFSLLLTTCLYALMEIFPLYLYSNSLILLLPNALILDPGE